ncbi:MAG: hypothetical protein JXA60_11690 [Candidatus Coatesbacteria bacterium]|nr:hypothetical protein [Candidatus Coatesbacteria bacterium]
MYRTVILILITSFNLMFAKALTISSIETIQNAPLLFEGKIIEYKKGAASIIIGKVIRGTIKEGETKIIQVYKKGERVFPYITKKDVTYLFATNKDNEIILLANLDTSDYKFFSFYDYDKVIVSPQVLTKKRVITGSDEPDEKPDEKVSWIGLFKGKATFGEQGKEYSFPLEISIEFKKNSYGGTYKFTLPRQEETENKFEELKIKKDDISGSMKFRNTYNFKGTKKGKEISGKFLNKAKKVSGEFKLVYSKEEPNDGEDEEKEEKEEEEKDSDDTDE